MRRRLFTVASTISLLACAALLFWRFTSPGRLVTYRAVSSMIDETGKTTIIGTSTGTVGVYDVGFRRHRLPFHLAVLLTAIPPILWIAVEATRRVVAWATTPAGCCRRCDYNLTGNTSGVCPECGTPVPQKSEATA